jgi:small subunit ribosomal protein S6
MRKYEIMYILIPTLSDNDIRKINNNIKNIFLKEGKILESKEGELKQMAYAIKNFDKGFYNTLLVETNNKNVSEFNRIANITEEIIRFIVLRKEGK